MNIKTLILGICMTNCYIVDVGQNKCVIIDPASDGNIIFDEIKRTGLEPVAILLTHGHYDHIAGIPELINNIGELPIYIHTDEALFLNDTTFNLSTAFGEYFTYSGNIHTVTEGDKISFGSSNFSVMHTPGHTPGSSCFICGDTILSGDTLFASTIGRTDFPGGCYSTILKSLKKFKDLKGEFNIYPGHNAQTTLSRELKYNEYLQF